MGGNSMIGMGYRVFCKSAEANGWVGDIDNDDFLIHFFWAKYCKNENIQGRWRGTRSTERRCILTRKEDLVLQYIQPLCMPGLNKVSLLGNRSLERLIRNVCELPRRRYGDGSDIVINYGTSNHRVSENMFMVNRNLVMDKFEQCQIMGEELAPRVWDSMNAPDKWDIIVKPRHSIGGRGIRHHDETPVSGREYYQEFFDKVREFRVHCFLWMDEPVTFIQEKVIKNKEQLTWNKKQGGKFQYPYQPDLDYGKYNGGVSLQNVNVMAKMSVEALKKLNMDFGGLDFGMDKLGNFKIFEVNSRMGLRERSLHTYKIAFNKLRSLDINDYHQRRGF